MTELGQLLLLNLLNIASGNLEIITKKGEKLTNQLQMYSYYKL